MGGFQKMSNTEYWQCKQPHAAVKKKTTTFFPKIEICTIWKEKHSCFQISPSTVFPWLQNGWKRVLLLQCKRGSSTCKVARRWRRHTHICLSQTTYEVLLFSKSSGCLRWPTVLEHVQTFQQLLISYTQYDRNFYFFRITYRWLCESCWKGSFQMPSAPWLLERCHHSTGKDESMKKYCGKSLKALSERQVI